MKVTEVIERHIKDINQSLGISGRPYEVSVEEGKGNYIIFRLRNRNGKRDPANRDLVIPGNHAHAVSWFMASLVDPLNRRR